MGGHALKTINTVRKKTKDFLRITDEIFKLISNSPIIDIHFVKCYHTKETHGDLDVLIKIKDKLDISKLIIDIFNPDEMVRNSNVISFNYFDFQIDFIMVAEKNWITAKTYFDYDCIGNLMGKTFHKFNLSYGWDGLKYKCRDENGYKMRTVTISTDVRKIFKFGGFDYDRFLEGFNTRKEIYDFIITSKYFNYNTFLFENLAYKDKKRNRKRESYSEFLTYVNDNNLRFANHEFNRDKASYLPEIIKYFPEANLDKTLSEIEEAMRIHKIVKTKFNGDMVMEWLPELKTGKEIGRVIGFFKTSLGDDYNNFILESSFIQIHNKFMETYDEYKLQ